MISNIIKKEKEKLCLFSPYHRTRYVFLGLVLEGALWARSSLS